MTVGVGPAGFLAVSRCVGFSGRRGRAFLITAIIKTLSPVARCSRDIFNATGLGVVHEIKWSLGLMDRHGLRQYFEAVKRIGQGLSRIEQQILLAVIQELVRMFERLSVVTVPGQKSS